MKLYPAIDILEGSAVRLLKGDYGQKTEYDPSPVNVAEGFARQGAQALHVVDLDGARAGNPVNLEVVAELASRIEIPVQFGGGLRTAESIERALSAGVARVVLGTAALNDRSLLEHSIEYFGADRIVVSVDYRAGAVAMEGWTESGGITPVDLLGQLDAIGVNRYLCTKIEVDGTMEGPDLDGLGDIARSTEGTVIASGGVGSLADLERLAAGTESNVEGVIVGRALYEGRFDITEAIGALAGP
jgi:phosphoribosylformimino-5-aminoimidazole carboxamide ribotide isomerase